MSKRKKEVLDFDTAIEVAQRSLADDTRALGDEPDEVPDPLAAIAYTGNAEVDSLAEVTELQAAFRKRKKDESRRFELATDSEYWCAFVFQTRDQKETFLKAVGLLAYGDKYLDGELVAEKLGIKLPAEIPHYNIDKKPDPKWAGLVD